MKRILLMLVLGLSLHLSLLAQPTVKFPTLDPCSGEDFCVPVRVEDFTDIVTMSFSMHWDSTVLQYTGIMNPNANMGVDAVNNFGPMPFPVGGGTLTFDWQNNNTPCTNTAPGVTLPDDDVLFEVCFTSLGGYGDVSPINVDGLPVDINVTREGASCNNIGLMIEPGLISTCVRPLEVYASHETGNEGDLVCVDFSVNGFDDMTSMQFTINYDETILQYENVVIPENLTNLSIGSFGTPDSPTIPDGVTTVSWAFIDINNPDVGITVPDSTLIFQLCFRIIGPCESSSAITFANAPTNIEITNTIEEGFNIFFQPVEGSVEVGDCDPTGLPLVANCGDPVNLNDEICVAVTTNDFENISDMTFLMEWNTSILEFVEVRDPNPAFDDLLGSFNTGNTISGVLGLQGWGQLPGVSLPDGSELFKVCFDVVGLGGNSPFTITGAPAIVQQNNGPNIGINPSNCEVVVNQPDGVTMAINTGEAPPGDTVCMEVSVANFVDVTDYQFCLAWDDTQLDFIGVENINIPGSGILDFDIAIGGICFQDTYNTPLTIADGEIIFDLCFIVGESAIPNNCDNVSIVAQPLEPEVITSTSNGNNVGITQQGGEVCVLAPDGFYLDVSSVTAQLTDTACVELIVGSYQDITGADFTLNWNPADLAFVGVNDPGIVPGINAMADPVGILNLDWFGNAGLTLEDSTTILEVCFQLLGDPDACYPITINGDPEPVATTTTADGSVIPDDDGEICILDKLIIIDTTITGVSCPGVNDGEICLNTIVASDPDGEVFTVIYNWQTTPTQFDTCATNLAPGEACVRIFVLEQPDLVLDACFTVPDNTNLPEAIAGEDETLLCVPDAITLTGTGTTGDEFEVQWFNFAMQPIAPPGQTTVTVNESGAYIFQVENIQGGCQDLDTVLVNNTPPPTAVATGPGENFNCANESLTLSSTGSTPLGTGVNYLWTAEDGGIITMGEETSATPTILAPGTYILDVTIAFSQCTETDTVVIISDSQFPEISAGGQAEIDCGDDAEVTLQATATDSAGVITYTWTDSEGNELSSMNGAVTVNEPGTYYLEGFTAVNSCSSFDSVEVVLPEDQIPAIALLGPAEPIVTCNEDTVTLELTVTNGDDFSYNWTSMDGGEIVSGTENTASLQVVSGGTFMVEVTNTESSCTNIFEVIVGENQELPSIAEAGTADQLDCNVETVLLSGTGPEENDGLTYTWTFENDDTPLNTGNATSAEASNPGTYFFTVTIDSTGCSRVDSVEVETSPDLPSPSIAEVGIISCDNGSVTLTATVDPPVPSQGSYDISWLGPDGFVIPDETELTLTITEGGEYTIVVNNAAINCEGSFAALVEDQSDPPVVVAAQGLNIDCATNTTAMLDGTGSDTGDGIEYLWTAIVDGENPVPNDQLMVEVSTPGTYQLIVNNTNTGCLDSIEVVVEDLTALPEFNVIEPTELLGCANETLNLQVDLIGLTANEVTIEWTGPGIDTGGDTQAPTVSAAGTYEVTVTIDATGCEATSSVQVGQDESIPTAAIAMEQEILPCEGNTVILDGSDSSMGDTISYNWVQISGDSSVTIVDQNTSMASVGYTGTFVLTVTNDNTGCTATDTVEVIFDDSLVDALAGDDQIGCEEEETLAGNLPSGATGTWTTLSGATISDPTDANTNVSNLGGGENVFIWTLSTNACPDYSFDEVSIFLSVAPEAENDFAELTEDETVRSINLISNDALNGAQSWSVEILSQPSLGKVTNNGDGTILYEIFSGRFGLDEFSYVLCNEDCPNQIVCDTASIQINVPEGPYQPPTGITPNGDGTNDELVFEILNNPDEEYPDNEIIIFNRWGDIVFEAKPYNNDWRGTNSSGQELPHATYYYILRLNISEGIIIRGDITILK